MTATRGFRLTGEVTPVRQLVGDVARSRELIGILARQSFYVQYRRAAFGLLWSILLPLVQSVVLAVVFMKLTTLGRGHGGGPSFAAFILSGTVAWSFLSGSLTSGSTAIVTGAGVTTKVYFPRSILPLVSVVSSLYGLVASIVVLLLVCIGVGEPLSPRLVLLPAVMLLAIAITSGFTLVFAALHVYFRDIRYIVLAALQPWFYVTPIFYTLDRTGSFKPYVEANPMSGVVLLFRWTTIGTHEPLATAVAWTIVWTIGLLVAALALYRRSERVFADLM